MLAIIKKRTDKRYSHRQRDAYSICKCDVTFFF